MQGLAAFCGSAGGKTSRLSPNVSRARKRARDKQLRFQLFAMGFQYALRDVRLYRQCLSAAPRRPGLSKRPRRPDRFFSANAGSRPFLRFRGMLSFTSAGFATSTGFTASAGSVVTADALPKPSRSAAMRRACSVMPCMSSRLTSPPFTASPICAAARSVNRPSPVTSLGRAGIVRVT